MGDLEGGLVQKHGRVGQREHGPMLYFVLKLGLAGGRKKRGGGGSLPSK